MPPEISVLGAGAFGTALAISLALAGRRVALWARDPVQVAAMAATRQNAARLPGAALPPGVMPIDNLTLATQAPVLLLAVPTQSLRALTTAQAGLLADRVLIVCCKGVERGTGLLPTQVLDQTVLDARNGVLTGPGFAQDIAAGKPTALTLAMAGQGGAAVQALLATPNLRPYLGDDPLGAQWGGALKNVVAIAAGVAIGAGLGDSARAALMTRGFAEMVRLAVARGAQAETLWGLSGFGDLVLTCTSETSRNFRHGMRLGQGQVPDPAMTVEGVATAHAVAQGADPDMLPITCAVSALLAGQIGLAEVREALLSRPLRAEGG